MKTNSSFESATLGTQEIDIPPSADLLESYPDYVRFINAQIPKIESEYQDYLNSRGIEDTTGKSPSVSERHRNAIHAEILELSKAFENYDNSEQEKPLRLDIDQLYRVATLTDTMKSDSEHTPAYLSQTMDDEFGKILDMSTDASDPNDRDYLFVNAYQAHRENDTPIIEEYNKNLREIQAFLPDGEKILYRPGLESYNNETVREILKKEKFGKAVMDYARHNKLIEYNQDLHIEWHRQAAKVKAKK